MNIKFKVKSKETGVVYFPEQIEILISPNRISVHDLNGIEIEDPELFQIINRKDSNGEDIFEEDRLILEYEGDQGRMIEEVIVRTVCGSQYLFSPAGGPSLLQAIKLSIIPAEMKLTLCKTTF